MNIFDYEKFLPTHPARMFRLGDTVVVRLPIALVQMQITAGLDKTFYARVSDVRGSFSKGTVILRALDKQAPAIPMSAQMARENVFVSISALRHNPSHLGHYFEGDKYVEKYLGYARLGETLRAYPGVWLPYEPMRNQVELAKQVARELKAEKAQAAGEKALREIRQMLKEAEEKETRGKRSCRASSDVISLSTEWETPAQRVSLACAEQRISTKSHITEIVTVRLLRDGKEVGAKGPFYIIVDGKQAPVAVEQITTDIIEKTGVGRFYTFAEGEEGYFVLEVARTVHRDITPFQTQ